MSGDGQSKRALFHPEQAQKHRCYVAVPRFNFVSPERAIVALSQGKQHRECSVRLLAPRQLPDVAALAGVVAGNRLVRQAQLPLLHVEQELPALFVSFN